MLENKNEKISMNFMNKKTMIIVNQTLTVKNLNRIATGKKHT
jgi:hypothetical protein